ncbi:MAG: right-handed parallel beta-helix repeat-containing protein [Candidatus Bathyarchaeia archaeon]
MLVSLFVVSFNQISVKAQTGSVQNSNTGLVYTTIQEALSAPETLDGHVIYVDSGTYYENIMLSKSVELRGENKDTTIIDGGGTQTVIMLAADRVLITGFTIQNSSNETLMAGISMSSAHYCNIVENNIVGNENGIILSGCSDNRLAANNINGNGYGIFLQYTSRNNVITGNSFEQNTTPVYIKDAPSNSVTGNTMNQSTGNAVYMSNSNQNSITQNIITNTQSNAIVASNCMDTIMNFNTITNCKADAIWLQHATNSSIQKNTITNNVAGILLSDSSNNEIVENIFLNNNQSVILSVSSNSEFYGNSFVNNTKQVTSTTSTNSWDNGAMGNYWSDYKGNYTNGIGTTPYIIDDQNQDNYPLQDASIIPEFSTVFSVLVVTATLFMVVVTIKHKLRTNQ